jgi:hypothetical protein
VVAAGVVGDGEGLGEGDGLVVGLGLGDGLVVGDGLGLGEGLPVGLGDGDGLGLGPGGQSRTLCELVVVPDKPSADDCHWMVTVTRSPFSTPERGNTAT